METILIQPMDESAFEPFGDIIDFNRNADYAINNGMCDRYHALARTEAMGEGAQTVISLGRGKPYQLPLTLEMVERHPLGSQAFIPLGEDPFLVVVAPDEDGLPGLPHAFLTKPGQGVNYRRNTWHSVLTPLNKTMDFLIVDREGEGDNLEEHFFDTPYVIANTRVALTDRE
ncbi:MAG: ureidoglycolate lyase [Rhizobiaceae bacterium]